MLHQLVAICGYGLEHEVITDIAEYLQGFQKAASVSILPKSKFLFDTVQVNGEAIFKGAGGCSRLLVQTTGDPRYLLNVRSVQCWLVYLNSMDKLATSKSLGLNAVEDAVKNACWTEGLQTLAFINSPNVMGTASERFCARCIRDGPHEYNSLDISRVIGDTVVSKFKWAVDLTKMDYEVVAFVLNETLVLGLNASKSKTFGNNRLPSEDRLPAVSYSTPVSLRPSTAYLLVKLLSPQAGDVFLDYMCGAGSTLVEAVYSHKLIGIGGDGDLQMHNPMLSNATSLIRNSSDHRTTFVAELLHWRPRVLPLRDSCIDIMLVNIPGARLKSVKNNRFRLPNAVGEAARVLVPGGRVLFFTQSQQQLRSCLDCQYFQRVEVRGLNVSGSVCVAVLALRTATPCSRPSGRGETSAADCRAVREAPVTCAVRENEVTRSGDTSASGCLPTTGKRKGVPDDEVSAINVAT